MDLEETETLNTDGSSTSGPIEGELGEVVTPQDGDAAAPQSGDGAAETPNADVPFHNHPRWKEVMGKLDHYQAEAERYKTEVEQFAPYREHAAYLKSIGFNSHAEFVEFQRQQEEEQTRQHARQQFEAQINDPDIADAKYAAWEAQRKAEAAEQIAAQAQYDAAIYRMEQQITQVSAQYPSMDAEEVRERYITNQGRIPVSDLAKKSHDKAVAIEQRAIANYNANREKQRQQVPPEGAGGSPPPKPGIPDGSDPKKFFDWMEAQGRQTEAARGG